MYKSLRPPIRKFLFFISIIMMSFGMFKVASSYCISPAIDVFSNTIFFIVFESQKMGKKGILSETKKVEIIILHKEPFFQRKICKKTYCSKMAIHQAIARFQNFGLYHDKKRSGRARKTSSCDDIY